MGKLKVMAVACVMAGQAAHGQAQSAGEGCVIRYDPQYRAEVGDSLVYWTCQNAAYEDARGQRLLDVDSYFGTTYVGPYAHGVRCGRKSNWPPAEMPYENHSEIHTLLCNEKYPER